MYVSILYLNTIKTKINLLCKNELHFCFVKHFSKDSERKLNDFWDKDLIKWKAMNEKGSFIAIRFIVLIKSFILSSTRALCTAQHEIGYLM